MDRNKRLSSLPSRLETGSDMAARSDDIQTTHQWQHDPFGRKGSRWAEILNKHRGAAGFGLAAILLLLGWLLRDQHFLTAESGLGYFLGIVSVCCILVLLLYPLRKRYRVLKFIGPLPKWFRNHMIFGVSAPIIALYHCNFQTGSLNSRIALFSALAVAGSGLIGRFIYSRIHRGLYGRKSNLKELLAKVRLTTPGVGTLGTFIPELMGRMSQFDREVLVPPNGIFDCMRLPFLLSIKTLLHYGRLMRFTRVSLAFHARRSTVVAQHQQKLEKTIQLYIRNHLHHVRRVAEFVAYDRLFALWHKLHLPFFVLLLVSVIVHIAVVHLY